LFPCGTSAITGTCPWPLLFGVDVEKPFDYTLDFLKIRIRQASNHTLEFMMLYGLHALHINVARLVQKLRLPDGYLILAIAGGRRNRRAESKSTRRIFIAPRNYQHESRLGCYTKINQIHLPWLSRHRRHQARTDE
jgi:hypothetical protein